VGTRERTQRSTLRVVLDRIPKWVREILFVGIIYGAYEFSRGVHQGTVTSAMRNGRRLLHWERLVHLDPESALTHALNHNGWLAIPACYVYSSAHYVITPIVLVWLYRTRYEVYRPARTSLAISTIISLVIFYFMPTAPPRLLAGSHIPDVLYDFRNWGWWGGDGSAPRHLGALTNQFAAMPSMHVGWALWCGVLIFRYAKHGWVRALGLLYPVTTTLVVLSTGNHYLLDTVVGALVMGIGYLLTLAFSALHRRLATTRLLRAIEGNPAPRWRPAPRPAASPDGRPALGRPLTPDVPPLDDARPDTARSG
jgi:hypothetical protein